MKDGATQNLNPLEYETTFENGRRTLHQDGDDFTLRLTPRPTFNTAVSLLIISGVCVFCTAGAFWPTGKSTVYGMRVEHGGDMFTRVVMLGVAVMFSLGLVGAFQSLRKQTTVECRRGMLTVAVPGLWSYKVRLVRLSACVRVGVEKDEGTTAVVLRGDDEPVHLLSSQWDAEYTRADLDHVYRLVRRAVLREKRLARLIRRARELSHAGGVGWPSTAVNSRRRAAGRNRRVRERHVRAPV